jgi:hypothetical protein
VLLLEVTYRIVDKHPLTHLSLTSSAPPPEPATARGVSPEETAAIAEGLTTAPGVDRRWYLESPPEAPRLRVDDELQVLYSQVRGRLAAPFDMFKLWNANFVRQEVCEDETGGYFRHFPGFAFAFDPAEPGPYPRYRFLPSTTTPLGLVTNRLGWRGEEVEIVKPPGVIRVAFLGASTTVEFHAERFAYPDYVGHWLNRWAQARQLDVRFEILNTGREGISSTDIAAIMRQELARVAPDIVVYYEGSNQFSLDWFVRDREGHPASKSAQQEQVGPSRLLDYSALARRLQTLRLALVSLSGAEPIKPASSLHWPESLDEFEPQLDSVSLPLNLRTILRDIESIRRDSQDIDSRLVMTSFVWMVWDGMLLNARHQPSFQSYFDYLNRKMAPHRYADIRRVADFQNRVYRLYAEAADIPFIDIAAKFPRDPRFFVDPIHNTPDGSRLRAWIVFQGLLPIIESRLAEKATARGRPVHAAASSFPAEGPAKRLDLAEIRQSCGLQPAERTLASPSPRTIRRRIHLKDIAWTRDTREVQTEWRRGGLRVTTGDQKPPGRELSTWIDTHGASEALIRVTLRLRSGGVKLIALHEGQQVERTLLFVRPGTQEARLRVPLPGPGRLRMSWANARPSGGPSVFRILELEVALQ